MKTMLLPLFAVLAVPAFLPAPAAAENQTEAQQLCNDNPDDDGQVTSYVKVRKCGQNAPAPAAAQDDGPVARCVQARSRYDDAAYDVKRLVSNPDNTPLVPTGGWRGASAGQWVQDRRSIGMFDASALSNDLAKLQESEALNQEVVVSCDAALQAALDANVFSRRSMLKQLGGDEFQNNWPSRKGLLAAEMRAVRQAIANLKSAAGL